MRDRKRANRLADLLSHNDAEFITVAYMAVLGRAPDDDGARHYLARLRAGEHKVSILAQLRSSPEGRQLNASLAGLTEASLRIRIATLPLLGGLYRLVTGATGKGERDRLLRSLICLSGANRLEIKDVAHRLECLDAKVTNMTEQIGRLREEHVDAFERLEKILLGHSPAALAGDGLHSQALDSTERRILRQIHVFSAIDRAAE